MDNWLFCILASALSLGLYDLCKKHSVKNNSTFPVLLFSSVGGLLLYILMQVSTGHFMLSFHCTAREYGLIWIKSCIVAGSWIYTYYALTKLPISIAAPVRATSPVWTFIGGMLLFHEFPNWGQALGMLLVFGGYYSLTIFSAKEGFSFSGSSNFRYAVWGALLGAASAMYDKYLLSSASLNPLVVQMHFSIDLALIFLAACLLTFKGGCLRRFEWRWSIPVTGCLLIIADYFYFRSVSLPDTQISQIAVLRRTSCLVTFFCGAALFREKNIFRKSLALLPIIIGVILIKLMG